MIARLDINGVHMEVDNQLRGYVNKKIGRLDRYLPRAARQSAHAEVFLKETKPRGGQQSFTCEIVLHLPQETLTANETTVSVKAAVDIAETKLRAQLKKYKGMHANPRLHRRVLARFKRSAA